MRTEVSLCLKLNLYLLIAISCSMSSMSCGVISLSSHKVNFSNYCHSDCHTGCQKENILFIQVSKWGDVRDLLNKHDSRIYTHCRDLYQLIMMCLQQLSR